MDVKWTNNILLLSEFSPESKWLASNAMIRNKTIVGLSNAVLVVQAGPEKDDKGVHNIKFDFFSSYNKEDIKVVIEQVSAMPGQGVTSMFNFGQSFGILKGICSAMHLSMHFVRPAKWKKYFNLIKTEKDASRTKAIEIFPYFSGNTRN